MIDRKTFDNLWKEHEASQHADEYFYYLDFLSNYLERNKAENPLVVEIGIRFGQQSWHYIEHLNADYIGMDIRPKDYSIPNAVIEGYDDKVNLHPKAQFLLGNSQLPETKKKLEEILNGRQIDVLFIDADHRYASAKKEWELYSPLVKNIVAFHDVNIMGSNNNSKFWEELVRKEKVPCVEFKGRGVLEVYPEFKSIKGTPKYYLSSPGIGCVLMNELREKPKVRKIFLDKFQFDKMRNQNDNYKLWEGEVEK